MTAANDKPARLANEKIPRLVLRFALTTLIALTVNSLYNLTDTLFISWGVGEDAAGGISVVFPFTILQAAIATALGGGAGAIVSRYLGEGKTNEAGEITKNAMVVFYATAIAVTALGFILMEPLLRIMGITDELYAYSKIYFIIILAGNIFSTGFSSIIRAEGRMLYGMLIWVIPIGINIALDAIFILGIGWGVAGSAAATVISQAVSFGMSMFFFVRLSCQDFKGAKVRWRRVREILGIGLPSLVQMSSLSICTALINSMLSSAAGTIGINSFAFASKIITYSVIPFTAIAQALSPIVGYNHGMGGNKRARQALLFCHIISLIYAALATLIVMLLPKLLLRMFTSDVQLLDFGAYALRIIAISFAFTPLPLLSGTYFQATGKRIKPLVLFALKTLLFIPLVFLFRHLLGTDGIWWAYVAAEAAAAVVSVVGSEMITSL